MLKTFKDYKKSQGGVAAVEFALIMLVLLIMIGGFVELSYFTLLERRAQYASNFMSDFLSQDDNGVLTTEELDHIQLIWAISNPSASDVMVSHNTPAASEQSAKFSFAIVEFNPVDPDCTISGCAFDAKANWIAENGSPTIGGHEFACDLEMVANTVARNGKNVPVGIAGKGAVVKTNIAYSYQPLFSNGYFSLSTKNKINIRKTRSGLALKFPPDEWRDRAKVTVC